MITSLRSGEIDVGIGLTEGWVAGLGKEDIEGDGGYRIVGTYVDTPLCEFSHLVLLTDIDIQKRLGNLYRLEEIRFNVNLVPSELKMRCLEDRLRLICNVLCSRRPKQMVIRLTGHKSPFRLHTSSDLRQAQRRGE